MLTTNLRSRPQGCNTAKALVKITISRPMAWSEETLEAFVPIITSKNFHIKPNEAKEEPEVVVKTIRKTKNHILKNTLGLPHPDKTVHFGLDGGKRTPTYMMLKPFSMLQKIF